MKLTSDIASVQHWRLARKRSTPPLHVIGSKPAPTPFLTIFTIYKTTPLLHFSILPAAGSSKNRPRVGPHEHEGTKQRTQRNAGTGGQKACTGPTASGTIGDPGTGRMFCGQAGPKCSDREPRTPVSRETNISHEKSEFRPLGRFLITHVF